MIIISNKIPINHSFQRLYNSALDDTYVCDNIEDAQDYASYNDLAYKGQLIFVKEYRQAEDKIDEEITNGTEIYSKLFYIDTDGLKEPCIFKREALDLLFELIDNMVYKTDISDFIEQFKDSFK